MTRVRPTERRGPRNCPLCRETLDGDVQACGGCQTSYHSSCLTELGGCATLGCSQRGAAATRMPGARVRVPSRGATLCAECDERVLGHDDGGVCLCDAWVHHRCWDSHACPSHRRRRARGRYGAGQMPFLISGDETTEDRLWWQGTVVAFPSAWAVVLLGLLLGIEAIGLLLLPLFLILMINVRALAVERYHSGDVAGAAVAFLGWPVCIFPVVGPIFYDRVIRRGWRARKRKELE